MSTDAKGVAGHAIHRQPQGAKPAPGVAVVNMVRRIEYFGCTLNVSPTDEQDKAELQIIDQHQGELHAVTLTPSVRANLIRQLVGRHLGALPGDAGPEIIKELTGGLEVVGAGQAPGSGGHPAAA